MGWWESAKAIFGDGGNLGCFPRIGRKLSKNPYAYPVDPDKRKGPDGPAAEEVVVVDVPEVPLRDLNEITGSFSGEKLIGQGSYAKVYRVTLRSGRPAVVKRLEKPSKHASNVLFFKQLSVASRLKHENFVRLLGYTISGDLRVLVYEFAAMGTLYDVLHGRNNLLSKPPHPCIEANMTHHLQLDHYSSTTTHMLCVYILIISNQPHANRITYFIPQRTKKNDVANDGMELIIYRTDLFIWDRSRKKKNSKNVTMTSQMIEREFAVA